MAEIRIIAGLYKNRKIAVRDADGLRPTPDRIRETLFNWLQWEISGARVLDAFAGTGALGLEALSRGAGSAVFLDNQLANIQAIKKYAQIWGIQNGEFYAQDALKHQSSAYDLIFLDPPFGLDLLPSAIKHFQKQLKPHGKIYFENPNPVDEAFLSAQGLEALQILKSSRAGQVYFGLLGKIND